RVNLACTDSTIASAECKRTYTGRDLTSNQCNVALTESKVAYTGRQVSWPDSNARTSAPKARDIIRSNDCPPSRTPWGSADPVSGWIAGRSRCQEVAGAARLPRHQAVAAHLARKDRGAAVEQHRARSGAAEPAPDAFHAAQGAEPGLAQREDPGRGRRPPRAGRDARRLRRRQIRIARRRGHRGRAGGGHRALSRRFSGGIHHQ